MNYFHAIAIHIAVQVLAQSPASIQVKNLMFVFHVIAHCSLECESYNFAGQYRHILPFFIFFFKFSNEEENSGQIEH